MRRAVAAVACALALALGARRCDAAASAAAALGCGVADCCYSGSRAQRFCACADNFRRSATSVCDVVRCAAGPSPAECETLLALAPPSKPPAPDKDCVCTLEYAPVCAGGATFPNACAARCAGVRSGVTQGAC